MKTRIQGGKNNKNKNKHKLFTLQWFQLFTTKLNTLIFLFCTGQQYYGSRVLLFVVAVEALKEPKSNEVIHSIP